MLRLLILMTALMTVLTTWWLPMHRAWAHHSYADYDRNERYELHGIIKEIHWANPHIIFIINTGEQDVRVEWITVNGAERTGISSASFAIGDEFVAIGSRHRDPQMLVMTVLKDLRLPQKNVEWKNPVSFMYKETMDDSNP
jgi:hypothetical protein